MVNPTLSFWTWYRTEYYDDLCGVYINAGGHKQELATFYGYGDVWQERSFSLTQYAGRIIQIEFHFTSDEYGNDYPGFFVDDVAVRGE
jgi:bacillopeptidase F (M6 metalloprotease family)